MLGWTRRYLFLTSPFFLPHGVRVEGKTSGRGPLRLLPLLFCLLLTFGLTTAARLLELPYWDNPAYRLGNEYLLATHDAYHWIAGAEGFEFGVGHPMSELARLLAQALHTTPALVGFWLPPFMGGVLAIGVFLWGWGLGYPYAGLCAGVLSSLAPAFCARTLLGFYDTDLVVLLFALLLGLIPALWLTPWLASPPELLWGLFRRRSKDNPLNTNTAQKTTDGTRQGLDPAAEPPVSRWFFGREATVPGAFAMTPSEMQRAALAWPWVLALILSGLFGYWMQDWHSLFPYLVRFSALILPLLILVLGPAGGRTPLLAVALCHSLPLLRGLEGGAIALAYYTLLLLTQKPTAEEHHPPSLARRLISCQFWHNLFRSRIFLLLAWVGVAFLALDKSVYTLMMDSFAAYMNRGGDISSASPAALDPLIFPSVAQSIIEVQTIALPELLVYVYPIEIITLICFVTFLYRLAVTPAFIWFAPLLALSLLSLRMGARMIMFAPPVLLLALCIEAGLLLEVLFFRLLLPLLCRSRRQPRETVSALLSPMVNASSSWGGAARLAASLVCTLGLAWPLISLLPDYTQGPIISREQAESLAFIKKNTEEDSLVWNWWDWGYASHHFARRHTIADGARHGGPSLFLPAAVYTTADPRFARQIIKHTANKGNIPGNVFSGMTASEAQQLMRDLGDRSKPLIEAPGKQYVVVSVDLLRLGLWVTRYGSWNFETKQAPGSLMNNLSQRLEFNVDTGVIQAENAQPVYAGTIDRFEPNGLERLSYNRYGAYHFIFSTQASGQGREANQTAGPLERFWKMQRGYFPLTTSIDDKLVVDDVFYNTMMVQLLLCPKDDPAIAPYFKLVFDNIYTRVYEVQ